MGRLSKEKEALLAELDAIVTLVESSGGIEMFDNISASFSPMELLLSLLERLGVTYDELVDFLAKYIVEIIPILEIAVKGLLLAKLKSNIDCNLDPRIPKQYRELIGGITTSPLLGELSIYDNITNERGIELDLTSIDYNGLLQTSPMAEQSHYKYFGTKCYYEIPTSPDKKYYLHEDAVRDCKEKGVAVNTIISHKEIEDIHELVRAKDMNAFLWFAIHKARFVGTTSLDSLGDAFRDRHIIEAMENINTTQYIGPGTVINNSSANVLGLCIKCIDTVSPSQNVESPTSNSSNTSLTNNNIGEAVLEQSVNSSGYKVTIVPTTNVWDGVNWYVDRSKYFNFFSKDKSRDYSKEFALFRLQAKRINGRLTNKLLFYIKPAPNYFIPSVGVSVNKKSTSSDKINLEIKYTGDNPLNFFSLTFDSYGKRASNGKYSVVLGNKKEKRGGYNVYSVMNPNNSGEVIHGVELYVGVNTRSYELRPTGEKDIRDALYECYPGFTVYEFNYDFIMGVQLFDATVIVAQLIESLTNIRLGVSVNKSTSAYQMRISEIIKKTVNTNGYEAADCFFSFSNREFDTMMRESELKRAKLYPFQDVRHKATNMSNQDCLAVLNEYDDNASLENNISVISRTINQASATIIDEVLPEDEYNAKLNFIEDAIEMLTSIFIETLMSPKLMLILLVNQKIMGSEGEDWTFEKLIKELMNIIMSLIEQIRDMLLQKLMDFVMQMIKRLLSQAILLLAKEYVEYYTRMISLLLRACTFKLPKNPHLDTMLDYVDYADIKPNDRPVTNEC